MRTYKTFKLKDTSAFKAQALQWSQEFEEVIWLDSNAYNEQVNYEAILAVDAFTALKTDTLQAFEKLEEYQSTTKDYLFGYLTYDLKEDTEKLKSKNFDGLGFPDLYFFQPKKIIRIEGDSAEFLYLNMVDDEIETDFVHICSLEVKAPVQQQTAALQARISPEEYLKKVHQMKVHIQRGDIYEANFCQEFYVENQEINPLQSYLELNAISQAPFATFLRLEEHYALSASPERYIKKEGQKVTSQPIKGTAKRLEDPIEDEKLKKKLQNDPKEIAENVMIVDLVRNDLSKTAFRGSVNVDELCGLYSFQQVHQLISTVSSQLKEGVSPIEVLQTTFPMGSMTGAPKISAMKIIEELETTKRGLYSGSIGYFTPEGDFDFSVIIRTILYNSNKKYTSCSVGSAITIQSIPESEYEECLVKVKALKKAISV
ncbi:anthranilate synthase component I family protein [Mesonia sp. MT50]|uniref:Anthranilate synthase component I family protein n=1 Tax=Mesonia profundi TaxID=3070998 RepID=A0ABU1A2B2_9FLAO|nr:anthranilate synthase component I family protein [Mesonia profundi]MDQ7917821.1 anthranilate synthase component I family protein [Mesonia profundi]